METIRLYSTTKFSVFCQSVYECISNDYDVHCKCKNFVQTISLYGLSICNSLVPDSAVDHTLKVLNPFVDRLISNYDPMFDEFSDVSSHLEDWDLVRIPRIGNGKHNIHFDPHFSSQHQALNDLAVESNFSTILSAYMGKECILRETGISLTRPFNRKNNESGEGMEWHSDGAEGEATVLMSLSDLLVTQGVLHVIPFSHKEYIPGIGITTLLIIHLYYLYFRS